MKIHPYISLILLFLFALTTHAQQIYTETPTPENQTLSTSDSTKLVIKDSTRNIKTDSITEISEKQISEPDTIKKINKKHKTKVHKSKNNTSAITSTKDTSTHHKTISKEKINELISIVSSHLIDSIKTEYIRAEAFMDEGNLEKGLTAYLDLLKLDSSCANYNYKVGLCYLDTKLEKHKAIKYLEMAVDSITNDYDYESFEERNTPVEVFYYLGKAYRTNYQFQEAIDTLNHLKTILPPSDIDFFNKITKEVDMCKIGMEFVNNSKKIILTNLGNGINTEYTEHSPVVSDDESVLIFTSRRRGSTGNNKDIDGEYFEDIYISKNTKGVWEKPKKISNKINTKGHEASIGLSSDGQKLFIYKADAGDANIYYSNLDENNKWSSPKKLGANINSKARETHACLSSDGNILYFTSDKKGGYGGTDIYYSKKLPDGKWGLSKNIGPAINTPFNEESPYIHADGIRLYFSSQGHKNMGGYDIFFSKQLSKNRWSEPENIGYPINTTEDDLFFVPTADGSSAYYSTHNTGGIGKSDIFLMTLPESTEKQHTILTGVVSLKNNEDIPINITVTKAKSDKIIGKYSPNPNTGKYLIVLAPGNEYQIIFKAKDYTPYNENVFIPAEEAYQEIKRIIELIPASEASDSSINKKESIEISNILFDFDQNQSSTYNKELNKLADYLLKNPKAIIEIRGHTDANGPEIYNIHLSLGRAVFISNYLIKKGANPKHLVAKGYGERFPIALNFHEDGSLFKEAQSFNRRVEFKVVKQGTHELIIKPIVTPFMYQTDYKPDGDYDGDKILNKFDKCPDTPKGYSVNKMGCPTIKKSDLNFIDSLSKKITYVAYEIEIDKKSLMHIDKIAELLKKEESYSLKIQVNDNDHLGEEILNGRLNYTYRYFFDKEIKAERIKILPVNTDTDKKLPEIELFLYLP